MRRLLAIVPLALLAASLQAQAGAGILVAPKRAAQRAANAENAQLAEQTGQKIAPVPVISSPPAAETPSQSKQPPTIKTTSRGAVAGRGARSNKTAPKDTVVPTVVRREVFEYTGEGRRDPFRSLLTTGELRPAITDLKLMGIIYDISGHHSVAIMRDLGAAHTQYRVTTGQTLGRMRVAQIKPKVVVFSIEEFGFSRQDSLVLGDTTKVRGR